MPRKGRPAPKRNNAIRVRLDDQMHDDLKAAIKRLSRSQVYFEGRPITNRSQIIRFILRQWLDYPDQQNITQELVLDMNRMRKPLVQRVCEIVNDALARGLPEIMDMAVEGEAFEVREDSQSRDRLRSA
jgi:hypothetical protein